MYRKVVQFVNEKISCAEFDLEKIVIQNSAAKPYRKFFPLGALL